MDEPPGNYSDQTLAFGPFTLHRSRKLLLDRGQPVKLGGRAFDILVALVERAGEVVSKQELVAYVWPSVLVEESSLRVHVAALRKALGEGQDGVRYVANVVGRGYCFVAAVERIAAAREPSPQGLKSHNLPVRLTRLVGREDALRTLAHVLPLRRFVTIVGPGGMGKTTLALALTEQMTPHYPDGVRFADLSELTDAAQLHAAVASALGLSLGARDAAVALASFLRDRQVLLVLDNCEHLVEDTAALATTMLQGAPGVHLLATSREPLRAPGEFVQRLAALDVPETVQGLTARMALGYASVRLFVERAIACVDTFELTDADAPTVAALCRQLDGMPLAIELAAAQIDAFGLGGLVRQLRERIGVLSTGQRAGLARHRTLGAMLDWSYETLSRTEQMILARLSVFRGHFTLPGAIAVAGDSSLDAACVVASVASLANKSLLSVDAGDQSVKYRFLDLTRIYATEKIRRVDDFGRTRHRHAKYLFSLFDSVDRAQIAATTPDWTNVHGVTMDDLRAALDWAYSPDGEVLLGIRLTAAATSLGPQLLLMEEMIEHVERALQLLQERNAREPGLEIRLSAELARLKQRSRGVVPEEADRAFEHSAALAREMDMLTAQMQALEGIWENEVIRGNFAAGVRNVNHLARLARGSAQPLALLVVDRLRAQTLHQMGEHEEAMRVAERVLGHPTHVNRLTMTDNTVVDRRVSMRIVLSRILWLRGFADQAARVAAEALPLAEADLGWSLCHVIAFAAAPIACWSGDTALAASLIHRLVEHNRSLADEHFFSSKAIFSAWIANFGTVLREMNGGLEPSLAASLVAGSDSHQKDMFATLSPSLVSDDAIERVSAGMVGWTAPEVIRVRGERLIRVGTDHECSAAAASLFEEAAALARRQKALAWELRAETSLMKLFAGTTRASEAATRLKAVYDQFSEGHSTRDLTLARDLLLDAGVLSAAPG